jgi:hypothetical protein
VRAWRREPGWPASTILRGKTTITSTRDERRPPVDT